jgi:hypothetical protein
MKKSSEALKQEPVMENMETKEVKTSEVKAESKLHIEKVQPAKGATIVADPGGCRPTGT